MNDTFPAIEKTGTVRRLWRFTHRQIILTGIATCVLTGGILFNMLYYPWYFGQEQPIPFSHRFHVGTKQLSCIFCHTGAITGEHAGLPPVETCMLCHKRIIVEYPKIKLLTKYYETKTPVPWVRLNTLKEFVYFNHQVHVRGGFDCAWCHGDVAAMDRVVPPFKLNRAMSLCIQCHRDQNMSHDCYICHR